MIWHKSKFYHVQHTPLSIPNKIYNLYNIIQSIKNLIEIYYFFTYDFIHFEQLFTWVWSKIRTYNTSIGWITRSCFCFMNLLQGFSTFLFKLLLTIFQIIVKCEFIPFLLFRVQSTLLNFPIVQPCLYAILFWLNTLLFNKTICLSGCFFFTRRLFIFYFLREKNFTLQKYFRLNSRQI